eukprot:10784169-Alexandrium_andersonii.AAC.1
MGPRGPKHRRGAGTRATSPAQSSPRNWRRRRGWKRSGSRSPGKRGGRAPCLSAGSARGSGGVGWATTTATRRPHRPQSLRRR